jgi:hypothetical protein
VTVYQMHITQQQTPEHIRAHSYTPVHTHTIILSVVVILKLVARFSDKAPVLEEVSTEEYLILTHQSDMHKDRKI